MRAFFNALVLLSAAYLLFVGSFTKEEVALGFGCGLIAALWFRAYSRAGGRHFRFDFGSVGAVARAIAGVPNATIKVAIVLCRACVSKVPTRVVRRRFVVGSDRDAKAATRRAVAIMAISFAPDTYALRVDRSHRQVELHSLLQPPEGDRRWLI